MIAKRVDFFFEFVTQPQKIGSITPSSSFLAKKMLEDLPWSAMETIVELGAGTGVFTHYIAKKKSPSCQVVIFEQSTEMRAELQSQLPHFHYFEKAQNMEKALKVLSLSKADCIVSGLPFSIFPEKLTKTILNSAINSLKEDGVFVAFQYSPYVKKILKSYFTQIDMKFELLNMPPAFIYKCKK